MNNKQSNENLEEIFDNSGLDKEKTAKIEEECVKSDHHNKASDKEDKNNVEVDKSNEVKIEELKDALSRERADFINFRNRSEKEKLNMRNFGKEEVIKGFLPVMDEIDRAKKAGDLQEGTPFYKIAQNFESALDKLGVTKFGDIGEKFDHNIHEALLNKESNEDGEQNDSKLIFIDEVVESGYKLGDNIFRTAKVVTITK